MSKKLILGGGAVVVGAAVLAALPGYTGAKVQETFNQPFEMGRKDLTLRHETLSYEKGYMSSRATGRVTLSTPHEKVNFQVDHEISHGVGRPEVVSHFRASDPAVAAVLAEMLGDKPLLTTHTRLGPSSTDVELKVPAIATTPEDPDEPAVNFGGASGTMTLKGQSLEGRFDIEPMTVSDHSGRLELGPQRLSLAMEERSSAVSPGEMSYRMDHLTFRQDEDWLQLHGLTVESNSRERKALMEGETELKVDRLESSKAKLGQVALKVNVTNMARAPLERAHQLADTQVIPDAQEIQSLMTQFLEPNPELGVNARVADQGDLSLRVAYRKPEGGSISLDNPAGLVQGLEVDVKGDLSDALLGQLAAMADDQASAQAELDEMLAEAEQNRFIVRTSAGYRGDLSLRQGQVSLNGEPRPELTQMLGMFLPQ